MRKVFLWFLVISFVFGSCPVSAFAEEGEAVEEAFEALLFQEIPIISSVGFFDMERSKSPVYSTVFSQDQLDVYSARSMHELLDMYVVGVNTSYHFFGSLIGQRGIAIDSNAKTAFVYGGVNLNQRFHFGYTTPLDVPLMGDIDKVEIISGPGAITQGSGAINGFINVIPKTAFTNPGWEVQLEHGFKDELNKIECSYGKQFDMSDLFVYVGAVNSDGYGPQWDDSVLVTEDGTTAKWAQGYPSNYSTKRFDPTNLKATINWNYGNFSFLGYYADNYVTPIHDPQYFLNTMDDSDTTLPTDEWGPQTGSWRQRQLVLRPNYTWEINDTDAIDIESHVQMVTSCRWDDKIDKYVRLWANDSSELEFFLKSIYKTIRFENQNLAAGFSLSRRSFYDGNDLFGDDFDLTGESNLAFSDTMTSYGHFFDWLEYSIFCEDQINVTDKVSVIAGTRFDAVQYDSKRLFDSELEKDSYWQILPRLGLAYEFKPGHVLRGSYQKGFRHPDLNNQKTVNTELAPVDIETMDSFELAYSGEFAGNQRLDINAFLNIFEDTIGWVTAEDPEQPGFANLTEQFSSIGGEIIYSVNMQEDLIFNFGYGFAMPYEFPESIQQDSTQRSIMEVGADCQSFTRYPKHMFKTNVTKKFWDDRLTSHASFIYTTGSDDIYLVDGALTHPNFKKDRYQLDIALSYKVTDSFDLKFIGKNLTQCVAGRPAWSVDADAAGPGNGEATYYLIGKIRMD